MANRRRSPASAKGPPPAPASVAQLTDVVSPALRAASALWREGRQAEASQRFDEAQRAEPNNVQSYLVPARAHAERFDFASMERWLARLVERAPRQPGVHHYIGETYAALQLPGRATAAFRRAAELPGAGPPTWVELAALCERAHRLDEAQAYLERALAAGYRAPKSLLVQGRIERRQGKLAAAEAAFRQAAGASRPGSDAYCQAWSELALMHDAAADYAAALAAIENCKQPQRAAAAQWLALSQRGEQFLRPLLETATRADFRRWQNDADLLADGPTALLTGFPRSGTTLLEQVLAAHPAVASSEERDFIGREFLRNIVAAHPGEPLLAALDGLPAAFIASQRQRYFAAMEYLAGAPLEGRLHLDKNPSYNLMLPLVMRLLPPTRVIVAIRDPRDAVLSCYLRYLPLNAVSVQYLDVRRTAERYALEMNAWLRYRERIETPWRQIRYEDTVADLARQAQLALETLGLPWEEQVLNYRQRLSAATSHTASNSPPAKGSGGAGGGTTAPDRVTLPANFACNQAAIRQPPLINSPSYEAVAQPVHRRAVGRWQHYAGIIEPVLPILEPFVREFGYS